MKEVMVSDRYGERVTAEIKVIPEQFVLYQNYPNPFNPATTITYDLPEDSHVTLTVYDVLGQVVAELVSGDIVSGQHQVVWNASNMASGVYIYRLTAKGASQTSKMILVK